MFTHFAFLLTYPVSIQASMKPGSSFESMGVPVPQYTLE